MNTLRKIYFICPNNKFAAGGVKHIYHQVAMLKAQGYHAVVLHKKHRKKENWFNLEVPIAYSPYLFKQIKYNYRKQKITVFKRILLFLLKKVSYNLEPESILVIPEIYGPDIHHVEPEIEKVIFNQNCYYTFDHFPLERQSETNPYQSQKTLATIVASDNAKKYLEYTFPNLPVYKIRLGVDPDLFSYSGHKKKQICYMPRKLKEDVAQVINILRIHGVDRSWKFVSIENKSETEVGLIMKESMLFLSFNHREGFGLPPMEAMAAGCYVIGYPGQGGEEYFNNSYSSPIKDGNILDFVKEIERIIHLYEIDPKDIINKGKMASDFIHNKYSFENEKEDVGNVWKKILAEKKS